MSYWRCVSQQLLPCALASKLAKFVFFDQVVARLSLNIVEKNKGPTNLLSLMSPSLSFMVPTEPLSISNTPIRGKGP